MLLYKELFNMSIGFVGEFPLAWDLLRFWIMARLTKIKSWIVQICDFRRGGLNVRLCTRIQTLLPGHIFELSSSWFSVFCSSQYGKDICNK